MLMKLTAVGLNVYYFFIRRQAIGQCLQNLLKPTQRHAFSHKSRQFGVELVVILLIAGSCFVPGGHAQFQLWYQDLIPFAL